jgi:hypothetical protein
LSRATNDTTIAGTQVALQVHPNDLGNRAIAEAVPLERL